MLLALIEDCIRFDASANLCKTVADSFFDAMLLAFIEDCIRSDASANLKRGNGLPECPLIGAQLSATPQSDCGTSHLSLRVLRFDCDGLIGASGRQIEIGAKRLSLCYDLKARPFNLAG
jgi:hypothetical protein